MAKQIFIFKDPFGNDAKYLAYKLNGKTVFRKSTPPTKEQINNDPAFHNVRMNNQEFAAAATLSKAIRNPQVKESFQNFKDTYMSGRLTGVCRKIIQEGSGNLGKREACLVTNGIALEQFPLNKTRPLNYTLQTPYKLQTTPNRDTITLNTSISKKGLSGQPKSTTHAQLIMTLSLVSKHQFNAKTKKYLPKHPKQNAIGTTIHSEHIPISKTPIPIQLEAKLPITEPLEKTTAIVVALGITFGDLVNNTIYKLYTANAMNIIKIL